MLVFDRSLNKSFVNNFVTINEEHMHTNHDIVTKYANINIKSMPYDYYKPIIRNVWLIDEQLICFST